jgi:hypothetical protein
MFCLPGQASGYRLLSNPAIKAQIQKLQQQAEPREDRCRPQRIRAASWRALDYEPKPGPPFQSPARVID